ncbi:MAG: cytochrome c [bacterium]|nr:cytochrome c [bacterium]
MFPVARSSILPAVFLLLFAAIPSGAGSGAAAASAADVERGRAVYDVYCVNCHGEDARGNGPTAEYMLVKPADLTRMAKLNGGTFPLERVYRTIDGREAVKGHGTRQMPIWGIALQEWDKDTDQSDEVRSRIERLTAYLESIQVDK